MFIACKQQKIPLIPPLFHQNKFVTYFLEKAEVFNSFLTRFFILCNFLSRRYCQNNSKLRKAHDHDNISIRMLKNCGPAVFKPFAMIFKQCADTSSFQSAWEKGNIVPIHKKVTN